MPEIHMGTLCEMIGSDPAFSAEVLTIANSPLCGFRETVRSVLQATSLLGLERLRALAVTAGMRAYTRNWQTIPALRSCWRHSLACALIAEQVSIAAMQDTGLAYTAGIMHDIGRLALMVPAPEEYSEFLKNGQGTPAELLEQERKLFSLDHCQAGRMLVEAWRLPKEFADLVSGHHVPDQCARMDALRIIRFSCLMSDALGFAATGSAPIPNFDDVVAMLPSGDRDRFAFRKDDLALRVAIKINAVEVG